MKNLIILRLLFYSVIFLFTRNRIAPHPSQSKRRKFKAIEKTGVNKKSHKIEEKHDETLRLCIY